MTVIQKSVEPTIATNKKETSKMQEQRFMATLESHHPKMHKSGKKVGINIGINVASYGNVLESLGIPVGLYITAPESMDKVTFAGAKKENALQVVKGRFKLTILKESDIDLGSLMPSELSYDVGFRKLGIDFREEGSTKVPVFEMSLKEIPLDSMLNSWLFEKMGGTFAFELKPVQPSLEMPAKSNEEDEAA